ETAPDEIAPRRSITITPQRSITWILELQQQNKMSEARCACEAALLNSAATSAEQAKLFTICGTLNLRAGALDKGRTLLENALALWQGMFGPAHCQVAATTLDLAWAHRLAGRYELSEQHARRALGIYETSCAPQNLILHQTLIGLSAAQI